MSERESYNFEGEKITPDDILRIMTLAEVVYSNKDIFREVGSGDEAVRYIARVIFDYKNGYPKLSISEIADLIFEEFKKQIPDFRKFVKRENEDQLGVGLMLLDLTHDIDTNRWSDSVDKYFKK